MKLPNVESAVVPEAKITGYLLSTTHRDGRHKAVFFLSFGFAVGDWQALAAALLRHAEEHEVAKAENTPFGTRYVVEGTMETPSGRTPMIKELDTVVLTEDLPEHGLKKGDLGTVVLMHAPDGYEVEFMTLDGQTLAVVSLLPKQVRPVGQREIAQARAVA